MTEMKQIVPVAEGTGKSEKPEKKSGFRLWWVIVAAVVLLALLLTGIFFLFQAPAAITTQIRDIFIIIMTLEFMLLGVAGVILIVQLAKLVNLLQNEIKPILAATSETIDTLKGTSNFLSEKLVTPVIKLNSYLAGIKKFLDLLNILRK